MTSFCEFFTPLEESFLFESEKKSKHLWFIIKTVINHSSLRMFSIFFFVVMLSEILLWSEKIAIQVRFGSWTKLTEWDRSSCIIINTCTFLIIENYSINVENRYVLRIIIILQKPEVGKHFLSSIILDRLLPLPPPPSYIGTNEKIKWG